MHIVVIVDFIIIYTGLKHFKLFDYFPIKMYA